MTDLFGWRAKAAAVVGGCLTFSSRAPAQVEPYPVDSARIEIGVRVDSSSVRARYWFARRVRALDLTYLTNACGGVGRVDIRRDGQPVAFPADTNQPWVVMHDTADVTTSAEAPFELEVRYTIDHGQAERLGLPLVQPAGALAARGSRVASKVHIAVRREGQETGQPLLPRFARAGPDEWATSMAALPSTVVVRGATRSGAGRCDRPLARAGVNGGFEWLVAAFIGTIALWIPLYFWWASRRRTESEGDAA